MCIRDRVYIIDILRAIDVVLNNYVKNLTFEEFSGDKKTQDAVIRQIAIIGETMGKLSQGFINNHKNIPVREAIAMRNVLVHDYDYVDIKEVWKTLEKDLPILSNLLK